MTKPTTYTIETVANGYIVRDATRQAMPVETWDCTYVFETFASMSKWLESKIALTAKPNDGDLMERLK